MGLEYYKNSLNTISRQQPKEFYEDLQQAFVNKMWENTSATIEIEEQSEIGSKVYNKIEVWMNKVLGQTTTFAKNGEDYRQIIFKDIFAKKVRGLYYKFNNNYWLADFINPSQGLVNAITIRRCNNFLKIIDPDNGNIVSMPCTVDYDMTSPTILINSTLLTPNNHAIIYVQANELTLRLFTLNKRFILNGRPFKLFAFQNALNETEDKEPTLLYLDLYLDEKHEKDNLFTQVAFNGEYNYEIKVESNEIILPENSKGKINIDVLLNGNEVERELEWYSENPDIITFYSNGTYEVFGNDNEKTLVKVNIKGNSRVFQNIEVKIDKMDNVEPILVYEPYITKIRQCQSVEFGVNLNYKQQIIKPNIIKVGLDENYSTVFNKYLIVKILENKINISCLKCGAKVPIYIYAENSELNIHKEDVFNIDCISLMG